MIEALKSPVIQIESLKTKFDTTVVSNSLIALLDYSYEEAILLQQLHYWSHSKYGVVIDGIRWIYKSVREWLVEVLAGMSEWKLRKTIASLLSKELIRREKLYVRHHEQEYQSPWWNPKNQTYYYSIDYLELEKPIESSEGRLASETTENIRFEDDTELSVEEIESTKYCGLSQNRSENTNYRKRTKQNNPQIENSDRIAAALPKMALEEEKQLKDNNLSSSQLPAFPGVEKSNRSQTKPNTVKEKSSAQVDCIVNKDWKKLIPELDDAGIPINQTVTKLLKSYPVEEVKTAIALFKARKREEYIPNPAGYFVAALKENWAGENVGADSTVDTASLFRYWYDLARELGCCSGEEMRDEQKWVCISGTWEKWSSAVERGYSLDYLKKVAKRSKNR